MSKSGKPQQSPSLLPSHEKTLISILEGMHKPAPMPPRASANAPGTKATGMISLGQGKERPYDPLPLGYISLYPTRLSI
jgi:hypothetical protein